MSRDISDRWPDADAAAAIGGPVTEREQTDTSYEVNCTDCDLSEQYSSEKVAVGRKLSHSDTAGHRVDVQQVVTDGSGAMGPGFHAVAIHIQRDGKRVAAGALLPSGAVAVEWNREAFPEGERTEHPTTSLYAHIDDAEQASGGEVVVDRYADDVPEVSTE